MALFARNERPEFVNVFQRAYLTRAEAGARSWLGFDEHGKVVMHVAAWPRPFRQRDRHWRVAILGDLLADPEHRGFWGPVALLKRAVRDLRAEGYDLLLTDPTPPSAGVVRAAGFQPLDVVKRYAQPINVGWMALNYFRAGAVPINSVVRLAWDSPALMASFARMHSGDAFRAVPSLLDYAARVPGQVYPEGYWLGLGDQDDFAAVMLLAADRARGTLLIADALWDDDRVSFASLLLTAVKHARAEGYHRLSAWWMETSQAAGVAAKAGFVLRQDEQPFVWQQLGAEAPPIEKWWLTPLDGSGW